MRTRQTLLWVNRFPHSIYNSVSICDILLPDIVHYWLPVIGAPIRPLWRSGDALTEMAVALVRNQAILLGYSLALMKRK